MSFFKVLATLLVGVSLVMAVVFVFVASSRELSTLELVVFQAMTLFLSLVGSFLGGRQFADARQLNSHFGRTRNQHSDAYSIFIED